MKNEKMRLVRPSDDGLASWMLINGDTYIYFNIVKFEGACTLLSDENNSIVAMLMLRKTDEFKLLWESMQ